MSPLSSLQSVPLDADAPVAEVRSRRNPWPETLQTVPGLPTTLKLYRIDASRFWQIRFYQDGKYHYRSSKQVDLLKAQDEARAFYEEVKDPYRNLSQVQREFARVKDEILQEELRKVQRDEITHGTYLMTKNRMDGAIQAFFQDIAFEDIDNETLEHFVQHLTDQGFASTTINGYIAQVRKFIRHLQRKHWVDFTPTFPKFRIRLKPRGAFTMSEYVQLLRTAKRMRGQTFVDWEPNRKIWIRSHFHVMPDEMQWLIRFMVFTFLRPGDLRQIQHKHIEVVQGQPSYLRITPPEVKRHKAVVISMPQAVRIYQHLHAHQLARGYGQPDDSVFLPEEPNRKKALDIMGWLFNWILQTADLKQGPHGSERSIYSLRHTAITFRLIYGGAIDLLTLARNARTSVEMIEKFYASTLSAEMNLKVLHGRRAA